MKQISWDALAAAINVNRRTIMDLRFRPGAPKGRDPEEWRSFLADRADTQRAAAHGVDLLPGLCSYDKAVAAGQITYADAKIREAAIAEQMANAILRRDLVTRDEVARKIQACTAAFLAALELLPGLAAATVPADRRPVAREQAREWVHAIRTEAALRLRNEAKTTDDPKGSEK